MASPSVELLLGQAEVVRGLLCVQIWRRSARDVPAISRKTSLDALSNAVGYILDEVLDQAVLITNTHHDFPQTARRCRRFGSATRLRLEAGELVKVGPYSGSRGLGQPYGSMRS